MTELMKPKEVMSVLSVSRGVLKKLVDAGELVAIRIGNNRKRETLRFHPEDVDAFISKQRQQSIDRSTSGKTNRRIKPRVNASKLKVRMFS